MILIEKVKEQLDQILDNAFVKELEASCKLAITEGLSKLNIVRQEEFEVQSELIARMKKKIERLEEQIKKLEEQSTLNTYKNQTYTDQKK